MRSGERGKKGRRRDIEMKWEWGKNAEGGGVVPRSSLSGLRPGGIFR